MTVEKLNVDLQELRTAIREEYESVACEPNKGYHFHTGQPLAAMLGYKESWLDGIPEGSKGNALQEMARVLKPGGRLQIGDILVQKPVPDDAKRQIDLWTG